MRRWRSLRAKYQKWGCEETRNLLTTNFIERESHCKFLERESIETTSLNFCMLMRTSLMEINNHIFHLTKINK